MSLNYALIMCDVYRYVATASGAIVMYPGGVTDHKLDPLKRAWYLRAVQNQGALVFTAPYLDSGGAGYIVTLSTTIGSNPVTAVVAIDFTLGMKTVSKGQVHNVSVSIVYIM